MRTAQELFDISVNHLRKQHAKSFNLSGSRCAYRGTDDHMCAIGPLIPDDIYDPKMEGAVLSALLLKKVFPDYLQEEFKHHLDLLIELQHIHDGARVEHWESRFEDTARNHHLIFTAPTQP